MNLPALSARQQFALGFLLGALMLTSRGHHFPTLQQLLPSASWAVFFLAGVYLRPVWALACLLAGAFAIDTAAVQWGGVSGYCFSPAYAALLPAYGSLWFAGRVYAKRYEFSIAAVPTLLTCLFVGALACELVSSGSFYFYSGRFSDTTLAEFACGC